MSGSVKTMGYPKGYREYQALFRRKVYPGKIGFHPNPKRPARFAARLRVARQFEKIQLQGYTDRTEDGYEGLFRVFLAYTALESLGRVLINPDGSAIKKIGVEARCADYDQTRVHDSLRENDPDGALVSYLIEKSYRQTKVRMNSFRDGECDNCAILAAGIRNLFAHGHLAPSSNKISPSKVAAICSELSDFVIHVLDEEFFAVIHSYCKDNGVNIDEL